MVHCNRSTLFKLKYRPHRQTSLAQSMNVVWVRRDARTLDNASLHAAVRRAKDTSTKLLILYIYNRYEIGSPFLYESQLNFLNEGLADLDEFLQNHGGHLVYRVGTPRMVFENLHDESPIAHIFFHDDADRSIARGSLKNVRAWAALNSVQVSSFRQDGTPSEGSASWDGWWGGYMNAPKYKVPEIPAGIFVTKAEVSAGEQSDATNFPGICRTVKEQAVKGGESNARHLLQQLQNNVSEDDHEACWCNIRAYLAIGHLSLRTVFQEEFRSEMDFRPRLVHWSKFCQSFRNDTEIEFHNICFDDLNIPVIECVPKKSKSTVLKAFRKGRTGYPLIDAIVRKAHSSGCIESELQSLIILFAFNVLQLDTEYIAMAWKN